MSEESCTHNNWSFSRVLGALSPSRFDSGGNISRDESTGSGA